MALSLLNTIIITLTCFAFSNNSLSLHDPSLHDEEVKILPFVAISKSPKTLHIINDYYMLVQHINLVPLIEHAQNISESFEIIKTRYYTIQKHMKDKYYEPDLENRLQTLINHVLSNLNSGVHLLPRDANCKSRSKREIITEEEPVNTHSFFPTLGTVFSYITGTVDAQGARVINNNFNNIKKLVSMSKTFAKMFNASLAIERKHKNQIIRIGQQLTNLTNTITASLGATNNRMAYASLLDNLIFVVMDLQNTIETIFQHTDMAENNQMGPLARDPLFLQSIVNLMNQGLTSKINHLYLLKLAAQTDVLACNWSITISYRFPVLQTTDFIPYFPINLPKKIKDKYFILHQIPHMITWSSNVLLFTEREYNACQNYNSHLICRVPSQTQQLLDNCLFSMINHIPWEVLASKCPLKYEKHPEEFITFTQTHMIYFVTKKKYANLLCSGNKANSKTITLVGAGAFLIPNGCRVKYDDNISMSMSHLSRKINIFTKIDKSRYDLNLSRVLNILKVTNVKNKTTFWDQEEEEEVIMDGLSEVDSIFSNLHLSPTGVTITLFSLIAYTMIITIILIVICYFACTPGSLMRCKIKCCCGKRTRNIRSNGVLQD